MKRIRNAALTFLAVVAVACGGTLPSASNSSHDGGAGADASVSGGASGAGGVSGTSGSGGTCSGGKTNCGGPCVDMTSDPNNCGSCYNICPNTATCVSSKCQCPYGLSACGSQCVDTTSDANNCGKCGNKCSADEVCGGASCGSERALWPMPNPPNTGLPNPQSYDITTVPGVVIDKVTGLMWQRAIDSVSHAPAQGKAYCASLTLGGHSDWRLPTAIELFSIYDFTQTGTAAIDPAAFPGTPGDKFWSSSPLAGDPSSGWSVDFTGGATVPFSITRGPVTTAHRVRCVRGKVAALSGHYTLQSGAVKDNLTGLIWQQPVDSNAYNWSGAKSYCANLALDGGGWRVPSVKELMTLVDFGAGALGPSIDTSAFPNTPEEHFWSSSSLAGDPSNAWFILFTFDSNLDGGGYGVTTPYRVRCVR